MSDTIGTAYVQIEPSFDGVVPEIEHQFGGVGEEAGSSFSSGFGSVMSGVGKVIAGATAAGAAAVGKLTQSAVSAYSDFEQLEGGAELLFGDAFDKVMGNAETAFTRVQMSANEYLEQANSYATGLKESLGGDANAAAELADKIMVAQADIVSATGASAESISNAFGGIMKNNFSMLDNLQLGIKPTKEGMQEVIDKMNEWNAAQGHATDYQMENLADMQSAIVDYVNYVGMAGYAHNEASTTIQGSLATAKASWENLLTAMGTGDTDSLTKAIDNFVESAKTVGSNIMPIIQQALSGVAQLIQELGPQIAEMLPGLISEVLPGLLTAGVDIIKSLGEGIIKAIPDLMPTITEVIMQLCDMLIEMLPDLIQVGVQVIVQLAMGIAQALPTLVPTIVNVISEIVGILLDNIPMLIEAAVELITGLADGLMEALPVLIEKLPDIIVKIVDALVNSIPILIEGAITLVLSLVEHLPEIIMALIEAIPQIITSLIEGFIKAIPQLITGAIQLVVELVKHLPEIIMALITAIPQIIASILEAFGPIVEGLGEVFSKAWEGIKNVFSNVGSWFSEKFTNAKESAAKGWEGFTNIMDKSWENTKKGWSTVGSWFAKRFTEAKENSVNAWSNIKEKMSGVWDKIKSAFKFGDAAKWGKDMINNFVNGITEKWEKLKEGVKGVAETVKKFLGFSEPEEGPLSNFHTFAPDMMDLYAKGITDNSGVVKNALQSATAGMMDTSVDPSVTQNVSAQVNNVGAANGTSALYNLLAEYLPIIASGEGTQVALVGDADALFDMIKKKNNEYKKQYGVSAFA